MIETDKFGLAIRTKAGKIESIGAHRYNSVIEAVNDMQRVYKIREKMGWTDPIVAVVGQCKDGKMPIVHYMPVIEVRP